MKMNRAAIRSASSFFLVTFSTAFLFTLGARLTGWFTRAPEVEPAQLQSLGVAIMVAVVCLAVGAGIRRLSAGELQSALLGASAVLLSTPLALAVLPLPAQRDQPSSLVPPPSPSLLAAVLQPPHAV